MAHYYNKKGILIDGADLRQAKKEGLYPSITTVLKVVANDGLNNWIADQLMLAALTTERLNGESDIDFIARIKLDASEQSRTAMDKGSTVHNLIERYIKKENIMIEDYEDEIQKMFFAAVDWINKNLSLKKAQAEKTLVDETYGFAGTADFIGNDISGNSIILDWKTQSVKRAEYKKQNNSKFEKVDKNGIITRPKPVFYPDFVRQLAALNSMQRCKRVMSVIIDTNTVGGIYTKEYTEQEVEKAKWDFRSILDCYKAVKNFK